MTVYRPIAANGFNFDSSYTELLPCLPLRPYIHCFWGTTEPQPNITTGGMVIPDTCMDIIFNINYTKNTVSSYFCALDRESHFTSGDNSGDICATFGIRFFGWTALAFSNYDLKGSFGKVFGPEALFPAISRELTPMMFELDTLELKAQFAENVFLKHLKPQQLSGDILNAVHIMAEGRGAIKTSDVASYVCLSSRQLERVMLRDMGITPKLMLRLMRHQMVYRELLEGRFNAADAVEKYGYSDQSHLIRDFRKFHILSPRETIELLR